MRKKRVVFCIVAGVVLVVTSVSHAGLVTLNSSSLTGLLDDSPQAIGGEKNTVYL